MNRTIAQDNLKNPSECEKNRNCPEIVSYHSFISGLLRDNMMVVQEFLDFYDGRDMTLFGASRNVRTSEWRFSPDANK